MEAPSLLSRSGQLFTLGLIVVLGSCASPPSREVDLDHAVVIANDSKAVKGSFGPKGPLRVLIATEKDVRSVKRCFDDDHDPAYVESVRHKISGRRIYVIRYPLPPVTLEDGDISIVGAEPCILIDRETGEIPGAFWD